MEHQKINQTSAHVVQHDKSISIPTNPLKVLVGAIVIYSMIVPIVIFDLALQMYQFVYFGLFEIPKIPRKEYVIIERWNMPGLTWLQRFNCIYCDYANGVGAWAKDVINWTEIHSCAIKNSTKLKNQEHTGEFYERELFE